MLTRGNHKLGRDRIWSFSLPSGTNETCPGMTPTCGQHCYAVALERYRPAAAAKYRRNLVSSRRRDFTRRLRAFLVAHAVRVVRIHVGGDFYSSAYARKWLRIVRGSPRTRFFFYTRSWRVAAVKAVLDRMSHLPNCRAWYSADRDTGVPAGVPPRVRVAWLTTTPDEVTPADSDLIFRVRRLRRQPHLNGGPPVCPAEDGVVRTQRTTCDVCGRCWRPAPARRVSLPVVEIHPPSTRSPERRCQ